MENLLSKIREQYTQSDTSKPVIISWVCILVIAIVLFSFIFGGREQIQENDFESETELNPEVAYLL